MIDLLRLGRMFEPCQNRLATQCENWRWLAPRKWEKKKCRPLGLQPLKQPGKGRSQRPRAALFGLWFLRNRFPGSVELVRPAVRGGGRAPFSPVVMDVAQGA